MNLYSLFSKQNPINQSWFANCRWHTIDEILDSVSSLNSEFNIPNRSSVAVRITDPFLFAKTLLCLDGKVKSILLLSDSFSDQLCNELIQTTGVNYFINNSQVLSLNPNSTLTDKPEFETAWIIPTSGTTSTPKLVCHTLKSLSSSLKNSDKGSEFTWGLLYDPSRFAGLQVFLQSVFGASRIAFPINRNDLQKTIQEFEIAKINALSASPTLWRKILMLENQLMLKQITLGGEIADQQILNAIKLKYPKARLVHIYASTEAGVGFSVQDKLEGIPESFFHGDLKDISLKISNQDTLLIRKENFNAKYLDEKNSIFTDDGYIDTGDLIKKTGNRYLFLGRANGAINVGGNKVMPEEVEQVIRNIKGIADVAVYAKKNPISGNLVAANVLLHKFDNSNAALSKEEIRNKCREQLEPYKIPAIINIVDDINISSAGKMIRGPNGN